MEKKDSASVHEKERSLRIILLVCASLWLLAYCVCGCVRKVYLPETAAFYRAKLQECMAKKAQCEKDVLDCVDKCDEIEMYTPSSMVKSVESPFAIEPSFQDNRTMDVKCN